MLSLFGFSQKQEKEKPESDEVDEVDNFPYLKNCIFKNQHVSYYQTDARDFVNNIYNAQFQRNINEDHVQKLADAFKLSLHSMGTFKVVRSKNYDDQFKVELIDGQHRVMAFHQLMEKDSKFNPDVIVELYDVIDKNQKREWYIRANNVKNFEQEDLPNVNAEEITERIEQEFKNSIVDVKISEKKPYRPKIGKQHLTQALKTHIEDHHITDIDILFEKIKDLNNKEGLRKRESFKVEKTMYEKAKKSGFYLGLYSNFEWIKKLPIQ